MKLFACTLKCLAGMELGPGLVGVTFPAGEGEIL